MSSATLEDTLACLKNPTRVSVLDAIKGAGKSGIRECELVTNLALGQSHTALSLRKLTAVGLVEKTEGPTVGLFPVYKATKKGGKILTAVKKIETLVQE